MLHLTSTRPVQMAVDIRPFKKIAPVNHLLKIVARNKKVFATILLVLAWRARRERDRVTDAGNSLQHTINQSAFASARRRANYDKHSATGLWIDCCRSLLCQLIRHFALVRAVSQPQL